MRRRDLVQGLTTVERVVCGQFLRGSRRSQQREEKGETESRHEGHRFSPSSAVALSPESWVGLSGHLNHGLAYRDNVSFSQGNTRAARLFVSNCVLMTTNSDQSMLRTMIVPAKAFVLAVKVDIPDRHG